MDGRLFRYYLRKGKKEVCPNCGKKSFVPYIDSKTGMEAGARYGRCERINSCGYLEYPKADKKDTWQPPAPTFKPELPTDYVKKSIVEETFKNFNDNIFFRYLVKTFGRDKAFELQAMYNIGTANGGGTIYWQQDRWERFRTAKVMYYNDNGRRDKNRFSWFVHKKLKPDFNYKQCFFGLHLTTKDKPVALCESEKTAIMMSVFEPQFTWVASGGSEMISLERLGELPRLDVVYPDSGQFEKWQQRTKLYCEKIDTSVEMAVERGEIEDGSDILDLYLLKSTKNINV